MSATTKTPATRPARRRRLWRCSTCGVVVRHADGEPIAPRGWDPETKRCLSCRIHHAASDRERVTIVLQHGLALKRTSLDYGGFGSLSKKEVAAIQREFEPRQSRREPPTSRRSVDERRRRIEEAARANPNASNAELAPDLGDVSARTVGRARIAAGRSRRLAEHNRERVAKAIREHPTWTNADVADLLETNPGAVRQHRRALDLPEAPMRRGVRRRLPTLR